MWLKLLGLTVSVWLSGAGLIAGLRQYSPQPSYNCLAANNRRVPMQGEPYLQSPTFRDSPALSPSGRYAIGRYALTIIPDKFNFYIEDRHTFRRVFFAPITRTNTDSNYWSPDEKLVFPTWQDFDYGGALLSVEGEKLLELHAQLGLFPLSWSDDSRYFAVRIWQANQSTIVTYDRLTRTRQDFAVDAPSGEISALAWSPNGGKLAYLTAQEVGILNVADHTRQAADIQLGSSIDPAFVPYEPYFTWSPDGQKLVVPGRGLQSELYFYDLALHPLGQISGALLDPLPFWTEDGQAYIYFTPYAGVYDMWRFDLADGSQQKIRGDIAGAALMGDKLALLLHAGSWDLEVRHEDGSQPISVELPDHYFKIMQPEANTSLSLLTYPYFVLNFFDDTTLTFFAPRPDEEFYSLANTFSSGDVRFIGMTLKSADFRVLLFDSQNQQAYEFPPAQYPDLPGALFDQSRSWSMDVTPALDDQVWLVHFSADQEHALYRFVPNRNEWKLLFSAPDIHGVRWSPDSQHLTFDSRPTAQIENFIVMRADGQVESAVADRMFASQWTKCGGLWAAVTGG